MEIQIKNRYNDSVIFEGDFVDIRQAVETAVKNKVNLCGADLGGTDLTGADLTGADLTGADMRVADLFGADLSGADLKGAYLSWADLFGADLSGANLCGVYLSWADLRGAYLRGASLYGADLSGADLTGADLIRADLSRADLCGTNLYGANLENVRNMPCFQIVPEIGPFYAFKKLKDNVIATLYVPRSAGRVNSTGRKCRVSKAKVVALSNNVTEAYDKHTGKLLYKLGQWVKPDNFNSDIREECTNGIHCFITKGEAENYR